MDQINKNQIEEIIINNDYEETEIRKELFKQIYKEINFSKNFLNPMKEKTEKEYISKIKKQREKEINIQQKISKKYDIEYHQRIVFPNMYIKLKTGFLEPGPPKNRIDMLEM